MKYFMFFFALALGRAEVYAKEVDSKGIEIAKATKEYNSGWSDSRANIKMILMNSNGDRSEREIDFRSLENENGGDKSLTVFVRPNDISGTAFLSHSYATQPDHQWLYLPSFKRVKRISTGNKSGSFMGSEFAYEDLSSFEIEKYEYKYLRDDEVDGVDVFVVEQVPLYDRSGYSRRVVWVDIEFYRTLKVEFYDRKEELLKTLTRLDFVRHDNRYWRPSIEKMVNHQSNKTTELLYSNYQFGLGYDESDFTRLALKRSR